MMYLHLIVTTEEKPYWEMKSLSITQKKTTWSEYGNSIVTLPKELHMEIPVTLRWKTTKETPRSTLLNPKTSQ